MFSKRLLADIKDRISIVGYIGERVPLKRAGRNYKGCCPFHNEKTPSFNVSDEKGIFHCFGCGEGGDVIAFAMKFDGLSFSEAVRHLAGRAGIEIPANLDPKEAAREEESSRKKRYMLRINEIARDWFASRLSDENVGAKARRYLQGRGISEEIWKQHFLGYADNSWEMLSAHLAAKGAPVSCAAELGLVKKRDGGGHYDFFRNRIMFPIISARGEVLGFSGRALDGDEPAKYINSPDSLIYHKSNCVYGLNRAQGAIRTADCAVLVEGNIDLIALHQAGLENVVAPLGTALTAGHVRLIKRMTRNITVVFDGDEAGRRAAARALEVFLAEGVSPRVAPLPGGEDPDSLVKKEGAEAFRKRLAAAPPLFEYFVERTIESTGGDSAGRSAAMGAIVPMLRALTDPAERGIYVRHVARRIDVAESAVESAVKSGRMPASVVGKQAPQMQDKTPPSAERMLAELMISRPESADRIFDELSPDDFADPWCKTVANLVYRFRGENRGLKLADVMEGVEDAELSLQLRQIAMEGERIADEDVADLIADCTAAIRRRPSLARLEELNDEIRRAENEGDDARLMKLLEEKGALATRTKSAMRSV
ncbi:MAG TPA: DNA primase [bacterium]|nr:DNA primase [bacterium]